MNGTVSHTGGCLCGAVRFAVTAPLREVVYCHCGQCRRFHGHVAAYTAVSREHLHVTDAAELAWYASSPGTTRGFCRICGSSLFWRRGTASYTAIAAGTIDAPSGLRAVRHIFVRDKGDYYDIADGLAQLPGSMNDIGTTG